MTRRLVLGVVFIGTLLLLAYFTVFLSSFSFREGYALSADFPSAMGINRADPVLVHGMRFGRVRYTELHPDNPEEQRVRIVMDLEREIDFYDDYVIRVGSSTLLGGRAIFIHPGSPSSARVLVEGSLKGNVTEDALATVGSVIEENRDAIREAIDSFRRAGESIANISEQLEAGEGTVGQLINETVLHDELQALLEEAREVIAGARSSETTIGRLFTEDALYEEVLSASEKIDRLLDNIEQGEGTLGMLSKDNKVRDDLAQSASNIREFTDSLVEGEGVLSTLVNDAETRDKFVATLDNLHEVSEMLAKGEGTIGKLLADKEMAGNLETSMDDLAYSLRSIREGRGLIGTLIHDETVADDFRRLVQNFGRSIEDAREAAPISVLVGALVGAL